MTKAEQILNLIGTYGTAVIDSNDGMIQNFRLSIDTYEVYDDSIRIFNLEDAEFVIPLSPALEVQGNVILCENYQIRVE